MHSLFLTVCHLNVLNKDFKKGGKSYCEIGVFLFYLNVLCMPKKKLIYHSNSININQCISFLKGEVKRSRTVKC